MYLLNYTFVVEMSLEFFRLCLTYISYLAAKRHHMLTVCLLFTGGVGYGAAGPVGGFGGQGGGAYAGAGAGSFAGYGGAVGGGGGAGGPGVGMAGVGNTFTGYGATGHIPGNAYPADGPGLWGAPGAVGGAVGAPAGHGADWGAGMGYGYGAAGGAGGFGHNVVGAGPYGPFGIDRPFSTTRCDEGDTYKQVHILTFHQ